MISPILTTSTLTSLTPRAHKAFDASQLQNGTKTPWLLDEIRFNARPQALGTSDVDSFGFEDSVQMFYGNAPITNGYVPIPAICAPRDRSEEQADADWHTLGVATPAVFGHFVWELDRPLWLPPGDGLRCSVLVRDDAPATMIHDLTIVLAGRALPEGSPVPGIIDLPYAAAYVSPLIAAGSFGPIQSADGDLAVPFNTPIFVDRLIGRAASPDYGGSGMLLEPVVVPTFFDTARLRLVDSLGNAIIRDSTPWGVAVPYTRRAWSLRTWLPPKSFLTAYVEGSVEAHYLFMIGMQCRRELHL